MHIPSVISDLYTSSPSSPPHRSTALLPLTQQAFFDDAPHGCHGALKISAGGTVVTAVRTPSEYASVRVVPHCVAVGQQRALTVQLQGQPGGVAIGVLPVGHPTLSSEVLWLPGASGSALSNGCSWYTVCDGGGGRFYYGGKYRDAPVGFFSGAEVRAAVDRRSGSGNGVVRFYRNGKALQADPLLPIAFAEEAAFVVSFGYAGGGVKILSFE